MLIQLVLRRGGSSSCQCIPQTKINRYIHPNVIHILFFPVFHLCLSAIILLSLTCRLTPSSGLSEAHDPSVLLRPLRGHPSPGPRCNQGIDFYSPCPLINHQGGFCAYPSRLQKVGKAKQCHSGGQVALAEWSKLKECLLWISHGNDNIMVSG